MTADRSAPRVPARAWHRVTAGAGLLVLVATIAYLLYDGVARRRTPHPVLAVSADSAIATAGGYVVLVRVRNDGGRAAGTVRVVAELLDHTSVVERRETSLDYVPPMSEREAGLIFARDPRGLRLVVRPDGFDVP